MFRGINQLTLDGQGRLAIPARYRNRLSEQCDGQLVVTVVPGNNKCLGLYPLPEWEAIESRVNDLPNMNIKTRNLQRVLLAYANEVRLDGSGRVLLKAELREKAQLERQVVLAGLGRKMELWDEKLWNEFSDDCLNKPLEEIPEEWRQLSI